MRRRTNRSNISRRKMREKPGRKTRRKPMRKSRRTTKRSRVRSSSLRKTRRSTRTKRKTNRSKGLRRKNIRHRGGGPYDDDRASRPLAPAPITQEGINAGWHGLFIKVNDDAQAQQIQMQAGQITKGDMLEDSGGKVFQYQVDSQTKGFGANAVEKIPNHWILRAKDGRGAIVSKENSDIYVPTVDEFSVMGNPPHIVWKLTDVY